MSPDRRCVVVGAGLLGLSAAWSLSRRGWSVDVLEAADGIGHPLAGSKGAARIFRLGYPQPHYVAMAIAARTLWRELEEQSGRRLLEVTGQLNFGDTQELEALASSLTSLGEPFEELTGRVAKARFPDLALPGAALFESQSGVLAASECLQALTETGRFEVHVHAPVTRIEDDEEVVTVHFADDRTVRAEVVVDCAGPASLTLLGDRSPFVSTPPSLPQVAYFRATGTGNGTADLTRLPVFIEWGDAMVYGLPVFGSGPHAGSFKVSHHTPGAALCDYDPTATPPPDLDTDDPTHLETLIEAVRRILPGFDTQPVATERCVYDNSPDVDFVLDRVGNVVVGCSTSGHGFKFGPLLGSLMADLAEGKTAGFDLRPFRIDRISEDASPDKQGPTAR